MAVGVAVGGGVALAVAVAVGVAVGVSVGACVGVGVSDGVAVGIAVATMGVTARLVGSAGVDWARPAQAINSSAGASQMRRSRFRMG